MAVDSRRDVPEQNGDTIVTAIVSKLNESLSNRDRNGIPGSYEIIIR